MEPQNTYTKKSMWRSIFQKSLWGLACLVSTIGCEARINTQAAPPTNRPPTIQITGPTTYTETELIDLANLLTITDPENDPVTVTYPAPFDGSGRWQTGYTDSGTYIFPVSAEDDHGNITNRNVPITVTNNNRAPTLDHIVDITVNENELVQINPTASDPDNDPLNFTFTAPVDSNGRWLPDYNAAGTHQTTVTVYDGQGGSDSQVVNIIVNDVNRAPVIQNTPLSPVNGAEGTTVYVTATAIDPDGDTAEITYSSGTLAVNSSTGQIDLDYDSAGTHTVTVTADDHRGGIDTEPVTVTVANTDRPPVITRPVTPVSTLENVLAQAQVTATDPDGDPVTVTYSSTTLTVDPDTGEFTPTYNDAGNHTITAVATSNTLTDTENIPVTVINVNRPPVIQGTPLPPVSGDEGTTIYVTATANDPDIGDVVTMTYTSGTLTVNPTTGQIDLDYNSAGTHTVTATADDGHGGIDTEPVTVNVNDINRPPVIQPIAPISLFEGGLVSVIVNVSDPDGDTPTVTFSAPLDNIGQWQTLPGDAGHYFATVTADDGKGGTDTEQVTITVNELYSIVFESYRNGNADIYRIMSDQTGLTRLTTNTADDIYPVFSRDKTKVAFMRETGVGNNYDIWIMNAADGTGQQNLTDSASTYDAMPTFNPDGTKLAFVSDRTGGLEIWVYDIPTTNLTRITNNSFTDAFPDWSPDGNYLVFSRIISGDEEIYKKAVTGGTETRLTTAFGSDSRPHFDPTSNQIVFVSDRSGFSRIYTMDANGANQQPVVAGTSWQDHGTYSPGGTNIVYASDESGHWQIETMWPDGTGRRIITTDPEVDTNPSGS